ncbi:MAG: hypothetical protein IPJ77_20805 [Planctomycetes bacterium]|nr:hypothetical protein [Planctomycetota bacterium]
MLNAERSEPRPDVDALLRDEAVVTAALAKGVRKALLEHKKLGHSIAVWQDGKVVVLPPEAIPVDEDA